MDGHLHFLDGGFQLASVDLRPANTPAEFIERLAAFASERKPGEWILGGDWDHERWPGTPLPRREWIDSVTPNNPVLLYRLDGHMALANSAALRAAGVTRATKDIPGGVIVRDPRTGEPTGILKDEAMEPVYAVIPAPTDEQRDAALERALDHAASNGVTAVRPRERRPRRPRRLPAGRSGRHAHGAGRALLPASAIGSRSPTPSPRIGRGDDWVWIGGVKGYMDGSLGSTTALFYEPYNDDPLDLRRARHARGFDARLGRRRGLGRAPGRGARHRRAGERPPARRSSTASAQAHGAAGSPIPGRARAAPAAGGHRPLRRSSA